MFTLLLSFKAVLRGLLLQAAFQSLVALHTNGLGINGAYEKVDESNVILCDCSAPYGWLLTSHV